MSTQLREVYSARDAQQAEVIRAALADAGIRSKSINETLQQVVGDLPAVAIAVRILVDAEDYDAAREIALTYDRPHGLPDWTCPRCGEANGAAFEFCWNCTFERPQGSSDN